MFTKEQYAEGKDLAYRAFSGRDWRYGVEIAVEAIRERLERVEGLPWPPTQITTGKDKSQTSMVAKKAALALIAEGVLEEVLGPSGGFWVRERRCGQK